MDLYRLSRAAKRAIEAAAPPPVSAGHDRLLSAHLLLGLARSETAPGAALARLGVDAAALARETDALYDGPRGGRARDLDRSGADWREVLEAARDEADTAGSHEIEPAHLFLAATSDDAASAARALRALGCDVEALRAEVDRLAREEGRGG